MKIGIVTYWNNNYGSVLQCLSTYKVLESKGYNTVVISRVENSVAGKAKRKIRRKLLELAYTLIDDELRKDKRNRKFVLKNRESINRKEYQGVIEHFAREEMAVEDYSYDQLKKLARQKDYAGFICGSDQIWSNEFFVLDPFHYLRFAPKEKRFTLAPSVGTEHIYRSSKVLYKKYLRGFDNISVREETSRQILVNLGISSEKVICLADPVLQFTKEEWITFIGTHTTNISKNKIVAFFLDTPNEVAQEYLKDQARQGKEIIILSYLHTELKSIKNTSSYIADPLEWIDIIRKADQVCTDSYHALVFSCLMHTSFLIFERLYEGHRSQASRITDFLRDAGFQNRYVTGSQLSEIHPVESFDASDLILLAKRKAMHQYWKEIERRLSLDGTN